MSASPAARRPLRHATARAVRLIDVLVVVWVAGWLGVGVWTGVEVRGLAGLSDTVGEAGVGLQRTADALGTIGGLPLVGGEVDALAESIDEAGRSASASGPESRGNIERLSVLLALAVALIPSVPVLAVYAPARVSRRREVRAVRAALEGSDPDPVLMEFLARRAAERLPYHVLRGAERDPWGELTSGRHERLARLELRRLGIRERPRP